VANLSGTPSPNIGEELAPANDNRSAQERLQGVRRYYWTNALRKTATTHNREEGEEQETPFN
jgi:hypothetical protein